MYPRRARSHLEVQIMSVPGFPVPVPTISDPQPAFLALLPRIEARVKAAFGALRNSHNSEDAVARVVGALNA
jgi:hypothetical protein